jgi:hypothetical protein
VDTGGIRGRTKLDDYADSDQKQGAFLAFNRCFRGQKERFKESSGKRPETENMDGCLWYFHFLERPRKRNKRIRPRHGLLLALLTIRGVCGTRCAQTATDPTSADGCDARPVTKG